MSTESGNAILKLALIKLSEAFDELVSECLDEDGKPQQPDHRALAKARGYLPPFCKNAYENKK